MNRLVEELVADQDHKGEEAKLEMTAGERNRFKRSLKEGGVPAYTNWCL